MEMNNMSLSKSSIETPDSLRLRGKGVRFNRIRRITGYIVGSIDRWNDSKKSELSDRVKHSLETQ